MLTQEQITDLVKARRQNDLNANNYGSNLSKDHELVKPSGWHSLYESMGLTLEQAEQITWAEMQREMVNA